MRCANLLLTLTFLGRCYGYRAMQETNPHIVEPVIIRYFKVIIKLGVMVKV